MRVVRLIGFAVGHPPFGGHPIFSVDGKPMDRGMMDKEGIAVPLDVQQQLQQAVLDRDNCSTPGDDLLLFRKSGTDDVYSLSE